MYYHAVSADFLPQRQLRGAAQAAVKVRCCAAMSYGNQDARQQAAMHTAVFLYFYVYLAVAAPRSGMLAGSCLLSLFVGQLANLHSCVLPDS